MTDAQWIESLHGDKHRVVTLVEVMAIVQMIKDGDLRYIDGDFITALADLAAGADAQYLGVNIVRDGGHFTIRDCGEVAHATDAIEALIMCEAHRDKWRKSPLKEPKPSAPDEALAREEAQMILREQRAKAEGG